MTENASQAPRPIDYEELRSVADRAQVLDVVTLRFAASMQGPIIGLHAHELGQRISFRAERLPTPAEIVMAMVHFELVVLASDQEVLAQIEGTVNVIYSLAEQHSFSDDQLNLFAEVNGIYTGWPYIRELVSTCGARLGIGMLTLPVWRPPASLPPEGEPHVMERASPTDVDEDDSTT